MTEVPADRPDTVPEGPIVATESLLLLQTPPVTGSPSSVVPSIATVVVPVIGSMYGSGLTVMPVEALFELHSFDTL